MKGQPQLHSELAARQQYMRPLLTEVGERERNEKEEKERRGEGRGYSATT